MLRAFSSPGFGASWLRWFKPVIGQWRLLPARESQLQSLGTKDEFYWLAIGNDPKVSAVGSVPLLGWPMLEVSFRNQASVSLKLYWDRKHYFSDDDCPFLSLLPVDD
jgi:hypothetical protein